LYDGEERKGGNVARKTMKKISMVMEYLIKMGILSENKR